MAELSSDVIDRNFKALMENQQNLAGRLADIEARFTKIEQTLTQTQGELAQQKQLVGVLLAQRTGPTA